mmetsp:Transcript_24531/g.58168  ORF Transcript_24531/g.58168 Transcript_24531/m.58168 type:complete len:258 (+) Transcript_24531:606-1379(+)
MGVEVFVPLDVVHSRAHLERGELHIPANHNGVHVWPLLDHVRRRAHVHFFEGRGWLPVVIDGREVVRDPKHAALLQHSGVGGDDEGMLKLGVFEVGSGRVGGTHHHAQLLLLASASKVHPLALQLLDELRPSLVGIVGDKHHPLAQLQQVVDRGHRGLGVLVRDAPDHPIAVEDVGLEGGELFKRWLLAMPWEDVCLGKCNLGCALVAVAVVAVWACCSIPIRSIHPGKSRRDSSQSGPQFAQCPAHARRSGRTMHR